MTLLSAAVPVLQRPGGCGVCPFNDARHQCRRRPGGNELLQCAGWSDMSMVPAADDAAACMMWLQLYANSTSLAGWVLNLHDVAERLSGQVHAHVNIQQCCCL